MRFSVIHLFAISICCVSNCSTTLAEENQVPAIGSVVEDLEFKDVWYLPRSLDALGSPKAWAIVFTTLDCPVVEAYLPELKRLDEKFGDDVQFLAINVGGADSIRDVADMALEHEIKFPFVKDFDGSCVAATGVKSTAEVVVLDADRRIRYRGRIDDRFAEDGTESEPSQHNLIDAINSVLVDEEVSVAETKVQGTPIVTRGEQDIVEGVTYAEHIAPIMEEHCQRCHRPGTEAPFSLITYDDVSPVADMVLEVVSEGRMPPWYASVGHFANDPQLTPKQIDLLRSWVAAGTPRGDLSTTPEPDEALTKPLKWSIDEPDLVITTPKPHELPAVGYVPYKYVILPYRFEHDTWIQQCEILPDNPRVVHHCNMAYIEKAFDWSNAKFVMGRVPGVLPMQLKDNVAFKVPKGATLILQIHYTTTGQPETCNISVGMRYAREVVQKEFRYLWMVNNTFNIPPGDPLHRVSATNVLEHDAVGVGLFAHMHLRGRDMSFFAHYPNGEVEKLLVIPNYSFDWQLAYRWELGQKTFPAGTKIECVSHYDNSSFNPYNPDPTVAVKEGPQTIHEMLNGVMFYLNEDEQLNLKVDPKTGAPIEEAASNAKKKAG